VFTNIPQGEMRMKKAIVEMSDLELVQRFLHRDLILFISRGKDDLEEFKKRNQRFINSMHFTYAQLESCYEEAKETLDSFS